MKSPNFNFANFANYLHRLESVPSNVIQRINRDFSYSVLNQMLGRVIPFSRRNHLEILQVNPGFVQARIRLRGNTNHVGTMYAGALFLLAELPPGLMAIFTYGSDYFPVIKEMTLRYLKPANTDVVISYQLTPEQIATIEAEVKLAGKADFILKGDLRDLEGQVVAQAEGNYQLRKKQ